MSTLIFNNKAYTVDHAVKGPDYVHGYDANGSSIVSIEGISDFSVVSYDGTYMSPTECLEETTNVIRYCNSKLKTTDGSNVPASAVGALDLQHITDNEHIVPSGADLNTYTKPGAYRVKAANDAKTLVNAPPYTVSGFRLIVSGISNTSSVVQFAIFNHVSSPMWSRVQNDGGTWGEWNTIYHSGNKPTPADIDAATSDHTHNYAGSSSAGGAATSANKVNKNLVVKLNSGSTEGTDLFTFNGSAAKTVNVTPSAIGAAASSHNHSASNITSGTLGWERGGTNGTSRLGAAKNLTNEAVSSPNYFVSLTNDWGKFGYTSVAQAKTSLGLTPAMVFGTEYATNERWNNGKTVYAKACSLGTMPSAAGDKVYANLISGYTQVIGFEVFLHNPSANSVISQNQNTYFTNTHKGLVYECPGNRSQYNGYAVIRYVK